MKNTIAALSLILLLSISCKKNKDNDKTCPATQENLAGTYKLTALTANGVDAIGFLDECQRDDLLTLNANGTYDYNDVGVTCNGSQTGTWTIIGNTLSIDLYSDGALNVDRFDCRNIYGSGEMSGTAIKVTLTRQ